MNKNSSDLSNIVNQLKKFRWIDLTHPFDSSSPSRFPKLDTDASVKIIYTNEKDGYFVNQYTFPSQFGTHIDTPIHFNVHQEKYVEDFSLKDLVQPLVVIDHSEEAIQDNDTVLTIEDIKTWESQHGLIPKGAFVAMRTDWSKRWPNSNKFINADNKGNAHYPGWSLDALKFIYEERGAVANGHETFDTDAPINQPNGLVAEQYVLANNHYQIEMLNNLDQVPAKGAYIFISVPRISKAPGFPVRAFAVLPN